MTDPPRPSIVITVSPSASTSQDITDLVQTVREQVRDYEVRVEDAKPPVDTGRKSQRGPTEFDALASIAVSVPWEALTGAVATILLEGLRDWTAKRLHHQKQAIQALREQEAASRPTPELNRPEEQRSFLRGLRGRIGGVQSKTQQDPELPSDIVRRMRNNRYPSAHQWISIYGPRGQLLGIVEQDILLESPRVQIYSPPRWPRER
jgi:hypothetical protein